MSDVSSRPSEKTPKDGVRKIERETLLLSMENSVIEVAPDHVAGISPYTTSQTETQG